MQTCVYLRGFCPGCTDYEKESYCGEAEDEYDMIYGAKNTEQANQPDSGE
jgi:hypothetical protein